MAEIMHSEFNGDWRNNHELQKFAEKSREQQELLKERMRFEDIAEYADEHNSTTRIDIGRVVKMKDKDWNITLYMMEKGKGNKDTYYTLTYFIRTDKFKSGIAYGKNLWGKFEKNMISIEDKYLTPQEADVILKKFEIKIKKQKEDKIKEQKTLKTAIKLSNNPNL